MRREVAQAQRETIQGFLRQWELGSPEAQPGSGHASVVFALQQVDKAMGRFLSGEVAMVFEPRNAGEGSPSFTASVGEFLDAADAAGAELRDG